MTRLEENLGTVDVELTNAELNDLQEALARIELVGSRIIYRPTSSGVVQPKRW